MDQTLDFLSPLCQSDPPDRHLNQLCIKERGIGPSTPSQASPSCGRLRSLRRGRTSPMSTTHLLHNADLVHNVLCNLASISSGSRPATSTFRPPSVCRATTTGILPASCNATPAAGLATDPAGTFSRPRHSMNAAHTGRHSHPGQGLCVEDLFAMPASACQGSLSAVGCLHPRSAEPEAVPIPAHPVVPGTARTGRSSSSLAADRSRGPEVTAAAWTRTTPLEPQHGSRLASALALPSPQPFTAPHNHTTASRSPATPLGHRHSSTAGGSYHQHGSREGPGVTPAVPPSPFLTATYPLPAHSARPSPASRLDPQHAAEDRGHPIFDAYFDECSDEERRYGPECSSGFGTTHVLDSYGMETSQLTETWSPEGFGDAHADVRLLPKRRTVTGTTTRRTTASSCVEGCHRAVSVVGLGTGELPAARNSPACATGRSSQVQGPAGPPVRGYAARRGPASADAAAPVPLRRRASANASSYDPERVRTVMCIMRTLQQR